MTADYFAVDPNMGPTYYNEGSMTVGQDRILNYTSQNLLTYDKTFGNHTLSVLGGNGVQQQRLLLHYPAKTRIRQ